jgi:TonB family protein
MKTLKISGVPLVLKLIIALPVVTVFLIAFSSCARKKNWEATLTKIAPPPVPPPAHDPPTMKGGDTIWYTFDNIPLFPGGDELLGKYISNHIQYPEAAVSKGIQGQVVLKFCISSKGDVSDHEIVKSVDPYLDAEALRVAKTLTKFEPAIQDGKPVASWYYLPISFKLK